VPTADGTLNALLFRLDREVQSQRTTVPAVFGAGAVDLMQRELTLEDFLGSFRRHDLGFSRLEKERIFSDLATISISGGPKRLQMNALASSVTTNSLAPPAEAQWAKQVVQFVDQSAKAQQPSRGLGAVFEQSGRYPVEGKEFYAELQKYHRFNDGELTKFSRFVDKDHDGRIRWREFFRWAGVLA
jgi:hypothetical protein